MFLYVPGTCRDISCHLSRNDDHKMRLLRVAAAIELTYSANHVASFYFSHPQPSTH